MHVTSAHDRLGAAGSKGPAQPQVTPRPPQAQQAGLTVTRYPKPMQLTVWWGQSHKYIIAEEDMTRSGSEQKEQSERS